MTNDFFVENFELVFNLINLKFQTYECRTFCFMDKNRFVIKYVRTHFKKTFTTHPSNKIYLSTRRNNDSRSNSICELLNFEIFFVTKSDGWQVAVICFHIKRLSLMIDVSMQNCALVC